MSFDGFLNKLLAALSFIMHLKLSKKINVGILIFNEVEVLDFAGPFEVFSIAENNNAQKLFNVFTVAEKKNVVSARNGLQVIPKFSFEDNVAVDILIIPGGYGAETIECKNETILNWIIEKDKETMITSSVCTGAIILAETKLLDNKKATTHWMDIDRLKRDYPRIEVLNEKFVEYGKIITSGGISAGINMSFHIIAKLFGTEIALTTAKRMEYDIAIE